MIRHKFTPVNRRFLFFPKTGNFYRDCSEKKEFPIKISSMNQIYDEHNKVKIMPNLPKYFLAKSITH